MQQKVRQEMKTLTAKKFDDLVNLDGPSPIIWTAKAIGQKIGCGPDFVRDTLAKLPGSPVRSMGGRLYAVEDDLLRFFRSYTETNPL